MLQGTVGFILMLPWPWPCATETIIAERAPVKVSASPDGRLVIEIVEEESAHQFKTCRLILSEPTATFVAVSWRLPGTINAIVGQTIVLSTEQDVPPEARIASGVPDDIRDFTKENAEALRARYDTLAGSKAQKKRKPNRREATTAELFEELHNIEREITDVLALINQGKTYHVRTLLRVLRNAITDTKDKPLPLLQLCAAIIDAPLIVYAPPISALRQPWPIPGVESVAHLVSAMPTPLAKNNVDIDVWLKSRAAQSAGALLNQRELINKLANSVGSHFDLYVPSEVDMLRSWRSDIDGADHNFLVRYAVTVTTTIRDIIPPILAAKPNS
jgi:hypothetical protein